MITAKGTLNRFAWVQSFAESLHAAIQIVRPLQSTAETQPQLQPVLLRSSAMIYQHFIRTNHHSGILFTAAASGVATASGEALGSQAGEGKQ